MRMRRLVWQTMAAVAQEEEEEEEEEDEDGDDVPMATTLF
jgi:hypothetical protein